MTFVPTDKSLWLRQTLKLRVKFTKLTMALTMSGHAPAVSIHPEQVPAVAQQRRRHTVRGVGEAERARGAEVRGGAFRQRRARPVPLLRIAQFEADRPVGHRPGHERLDAPGQRAALVGQHLGRRLGCQDRGAVAQQAAEESRVVVGGRPARRLRHRRRAEPVAVEQLHAGRERGPRRAPTRRARPPAVRATSRSCRAARARPRAGRCRCRCRWRARSPRRPARRPGSSRPAARPVRAPARSRRRGRAAAATAAARPRAPPEARRSARAASAA